jgi:UDP-glucose 4-epimerase
MKYILIIGGCGYVGSRLFTYLSELGYKVATIDLELFGNFVNPDNIRRGLENITSEDLEGFDVIINLAGHSSILMADNHRREALENNIIAFYNILQRVGKKKYIYASSSSVYHGVKKTMADEDSVSYNFNNLYDLTKLFGDKIADLYADQFYGLRFGTVCGHSPNLRTDVMINKMVCTALGEGKVVVYNKNLNRPILGIRDLCLAVHRLIERDGPSGFYNMASMNATILDIGRSVAEIMRVPLVYMGETNAYDFKISSEKFCGIYDFVFKENILSITEELIKNWNPAQHGIRI